MTRTEYISLVEKIANGTASDAEIALYNASFNAFQKNEESWEQLGLNPEALEQESIERFYEAIEPVTAKAVKLWPRVISVAAAVAAIVFGIWFYTSRHLEGSAATRDLLNYANDIAPGKNTATIKIGDGEAITLSDKKSGVIVGEDLRYSDNTLVIQSDPLSSRANAKDLTATITTPRGGTYQVTLPDGTKVWLNAASVLTYTMPLNERGGVRLVELSGEAYFEVFRNKNQPFVVTTKNLTTTVLGTHFNISAYDDEGSTKATLLEGSVRVSSFRGKRSDEKPLGHANSRDLSYRRDDGGAERGAEGGVVLQPSQQALVTGGSGITVKQVDANAAIDWKEGTFVFNKASLEEILRKVTRWYDVDIVDLRKQKDQITFTGKMSRYDNISKVLSKLALTDEVKFKIDGRKIIVQ